MKTAIAVYKITLGQIGFFSSFSPFLRQTIFIITIIVFDLLSFIRRMNEYVRIKLM